MNGILVVDLRHEVRVVLRKRLELCGFRVLSAANLRDGAGHFFGARPPTLALINRNALFLSLGDFCLTRAHHPKTCTVPILLFGLGGNTYAGENVRDLGQTESLDDLVNVVQNARS